jgi:4-alpha-glucanotransferase
LPAEADGQISDSLARVRAPAAVLPPLITADAGQPVRVPVAPGRYQLTLEDGRLFDGTSEGDGATSTLPAILEPGYHALHIGGTRTTLAVAPQRCFTAPEAMGCAKGFGLAVQLYSLRRSGDAGIGDFTALAELAAPAARHGAQALAISPVHAQFSADPDRFSPYSPSSRTALNVLHAAVPAGNGQLSAGALVDWPAASRFRLAQLRREFETARHSERDALDTFLIEHGARLYEHALFEALHEHFFGQDSTKWHWRTWPAGFQERAGAAITAFEAEHADNIRFHAWLQFRADGGLARAQAACRDAGMGIGLISDLAVGTDSGGSQCWSRQRETLLGLTVGAPPDLLQRDGQNWGLTAFSPTGLVVSGFATYRDMLHTAFAHAGGVRIDHAMGLNRLWVIPDGASGADGAYLRFPETDFLRLIRLESQRHRAIVLAEDLGTVPEGFQDRLREAAIDGLRVLWFERDQAQVFTRPADWTPRAAAMTSTHDLPTLAGWWTGRDLEWRAKLGNLPDVEPAYAEREADRQAIWQAMRESGAATADRPADADEFVDAACRHVGGSACELVMVPMEDALGLAEQPNLPGTLHEHPNWQRRLPDDVSVVLESGATPQRLAALNEARQR